MARELRGSRVASTSMYGRLDSLRGASKVKGSSRNPRAAGPRVKPRLGYLTIEDSMRADKVRSAARRAILLGSVSVTETAPAEKVKTTPGWDKRVWLHDDLPGADRSTRREELIPFISSFLGANNPADSAWRTRQEQKDRMDAARENLRAAMMRMEYLRKERVNTIALDLGRF